MAQSGPRQAAEQARAAHASAEAEVGRTPETSDARRPALERRQDAARAWRRAADAWATAAPDDPAAKAELDAASAAVSAAAISPRGGTVPQ
jgi:hypothetical protein